jgi:hypothetical protein
MAEQATETAAIRLEADELGAHRDPIDASRPDDEIFAPPLLACRPGAIDAL